MTSNPSDLSNKAARLAATTLSLAVTLVSCLGHHGSAADPESTAKLIERFHREFVEIRPGSDKFPAEFQMGSDSVPNAGPVRLVKMTTPFSIARYEVPQNLFEAVMGFDKSRWKGPRNSSEMMSWHEAQAFCERVTEQLRKANLIGPKDIVRLPTEAEWEYCCRAGSTTEYSFGDSAQAPDDDGNKASRLDPYAWHTGNAAGNDPPVGALKPNAWGLYDMHGYLSEFVLDDWHADYSEAPSDSAAFVAQPAGEQTVIRGGSWRDRFDALRSASRKEWSRRARGDDVGFRCVLIKSS